MALVQDHEFSVEELVQLTRYRNPKAEQSNQLQSVASGQGDHNRMRWIDLDHRHTVQVPFFLSLIYSLNAELDTLAYNALVKPPRFLRSA